MNERIAELVVELSRLPPIAARQRLQSLVEDLPLPDRFELLHRLGVYHHDESASGAASTLAETAALRRELPRLVQAWGVRSVLDVPCGDFHWMQHVALGAEYTGADVVPEIVQTNQRRSGGSSRRFVVLDATRDPLPRADLVLSRDLLIHLSLDDCWAVLRNVVASGARLLLTNHFAARASNPDIVSGDFRPINLCAPPFGLPPPHEIVDERSELGEGAFQDRTMALWRLADVAAALEHGTPGPPPSPR